MGVRYVVVVEADRPVARRRVPVPAAVTDSLGEQLDLAEVEVDEGVHVFRNEAWFPTRADVGSLDAVTLDGGYLRAAAAVDLSGAPAVLAPGDGADRYEGPVDGDVWFSAASSGGWELSVDGRRATRIDGFGWGNAYAVEEAGEATLSYATPLGRLALSAVQAALWGVTIYALVRTRRRRSGDGA
jgi:hypothetical protein